MTDSLTDTTHRALQRIAARAQRESRTPALVAALARHGRTLWQTGIGTADLDDPGVALGPDTQFPVASNTKTFTAALVMALRDEGRLRLDDPVAEHVPGSGHPHVTVRGLLAHASGLQREPVGDPWDTLGPPRPNDPAENLAAAEQVLGPHERLHYSNLGYMLLGELVARLDGRSWAESLRARLLEPLGLDRTTLDPVAPVAGRYYVPPFSDVPVREPILMRDVMAPVGGLWSTVEDLVTWHGFLLDPDPEILRPQSVAEMRRPQIADDADRAGYGLGLYLLPGAEGTWFGHTGGAPGGITAAFSHADSGTTAVVLTNNSVTRDPAGTALALGGHVLAHDPAPPEPWVPGTEVPEALRPLLGTWFSEGSPFLFSVRRGRLQARAATAPPSDPPAEFEPIGEDEYRTVAGRERGERLRVRRRADGSIHRLLWSGYRFTREPLGFGEPAE